MMTPKLKNTDKDIWSTISCQCDPLEEDLCSWLFFQYETLGIENKILENGRTLLLASFSESNEKIKDIERLRHHLEEVGLAECAKTLEKKTLDNEDWLSNWKMHFAPFKIGHSFLICPPWSIKIVKNEDRQEIKRIIIDPGMAFGTGLHVTTAFCMQAIEKYLHGTNILDVGTGSGILSITSALSLADAQIIAIDMDENAIDNAKHNIELNHVQSQIELIHSNLEDFDKTQKKHFDTIFSNLTAEVIIDCLPIYNKILANSGTLILAGIIEEQMSLLENELSQYSFKLIDKKINSGWVGLVLTKYD